MAHVRPFTRDDIPQVSELHRRVFGTGPAGPGLHAAYHAYFTGVFLEHPWSDDAMPSLVCEEDGDRITGFLGVTPRRMLLDGHAVRVAVSSQFMVEPGSRAQLGAVKLLRAFAAGPQDLSLADEANEASRRIWEAVGGSTALLYGLYWLRPLRPAGCVVRRLEQRGTHPAAVSAWGAVGRVADAVLDRLPGAPLRPRAPADPGGVLDGETLARGLADVGRRFRLRPIYDPGTLEWLFGVLAGKRGQGAFQRVAVRGPGHEPLGWYLYYSNPGGVGEVLQVGARDGAMGAVLDHLFHRAWREGLVALSGRIEPRHVRELSERDCIFYHRGYWTLVGSDRPGVLEAIHAGQALLTRLEGEWSMRFAPEGLPVPPRAPAGVAAGRSA
jgi:hypothetical protein